MNGITRSPTRFIVPAEFEQGGFAGMMPFLCRDG
jgi:hypothetical protein